MQPPITPRIVSSDLFDGGILVSFEDGTTAMFSAAVLYANLFQAEAVRDVDQEDDL
jgi:hypothetical protein